MTEDPPPVTLDVNGEQRQVKVSPTTPLMYALRNDLGLKGVRPGCSIGECGACRVLIDGASVQSCTMPVEEVVGARIVTPEGLGAPDAPHPVQQAFLDEQAGQCGYCINGMITSVAAYVAGHASADAEGLRNALREHICRCGTHGRILRAACRAAGLPVTPAGPETVVVELAGEVAAEPLEAPAHVVAQPQIERWIELRPDGHVDFYPGKVELGQGLLTALCQVVAAHVGVPLDRVHACPTTTRRSPDQGQTSGSFSMEHGGTALAMAATSLRRVLLARAAKQLRRDPADIDLDADGAVAPATGERMSYRDLLADGPVTGLIEPTDRPRWADVALGDPVHREDLRPKLTGAPGYLTDLELPGMLHARAVLPPGYSAVPGDLDAGTVRSMPGVVEVIREGRLLIVVAEREEEAVRAQARLQTQTDWSEGGEIEERDTERLLRGLPSEEYVRRRDDDVPAMLTSLAGHAASYVKPYQAHGPMGPSVAVARSDGSMLEIWTHSQGIYPLRREIAAFLGRPESSLLVEQVDGPGCYGLTCADDAALLAALAARAMAGRPVRLALSMPQEFAWDPYGPGMVGDLQAALDHAGRIRAWKSDVISDSHSTRAIGDGDRLMPAWLSARGIERPWVGLGEPSARNSWPPYDIPSLDITSHGVRGPLRTGPLRSLGAFFNLFAVESFMDELAERAGQDPVAFRLAHLSDFRAVRVIELAAARAGWEPHVGPSGRGFGVAFGRYKDTKAYVAEVAEVDVDPEMGEFRVVRLLAVCDAGRVVNRDGLRNQLEGGLVQGLSRTLYEELHLSADGVREQDWTSYRTMRFAEVPPIEVILVDRPDCPPLGAGEASTPLVPAAVANAIDDAIGVRLRRLPFTTERLENRLLEMDERDAARVVL